ncbi:hypothetical protein EYF80_011601 [Liparis tanakae]|uniref:Uncharacterized protein n=1 Tax=Liparis tanakae TaxID=230148 RepID=A0A4Z2IJP6_9TELE|nr:hypothetical protein EYF80_011601 [Liparis tanakae]
MVKISVASCALHNMSVGLDEACSRLDWEVFARLGLQQALPPGIMASMTPDLRVAVIDTLSKYDPEETGPLESRCLNSASTCWSR